jgi:hypothetical protein
MFPNTVSEITHPLGGVISNPNSKPLIVVAFDRSKSSARGLPIDEFTRRFTPPIFVGMGRVIGRKKEPDRKGINPHPGKTGRVNPVANRR